MIRLTQGALVSCSRNGFAEWDGDDSPVANGDDMLCCKVNAEKLC